MATITINIPDKVELDPKQTVRFLAAKLYEVGRLSLAQAAEMAELSKTTFAELLSDYDVPLFMADITSLSSKL